MASVIRTFIAIPQNVREWVKFLETLFFSNTCTLSLTGCTSTPSETVRYSVSAGIVALQLPLIQGTSNSTTATLQTLPLQLRPASAKSAIGIVKDNGALAIGSYSIGTDGIIQLTPTVGSVNFTSSGSKGAVGGLIYQLD